MNFATMMALEPHGADTYVGVGPRYPWGGLYGGQIVAQGLRAAALTLLAERDLYVHSLHAYFIRRGDHEEPIRFEVDRVRNGRSFATRRVVARQSGGAILTMEASFQVHEDAVDIQPFPLPAALPPDTAEFWQSGDKGWSTIFDRRLAPNPGPGRVQGWLRVVDEIGDDPLLHACALAYVSDDLPTDALVSMHPGYRAGEEWPFMNASLDHAIWFHRPQRADTWQLHDFTGHALTGNRGTTIGHVFAATGMHVATVAQEVVIRPTA